MIFMPPRHGKSELASRRFPAYFLGNNPKRSIIGASYNSALATDFGREVRNIVGSPGYRSLFDIGLSSDSKAANRWSTSEGGAYVAAGVGTSVTGRGADIFLIDDPLKDREEADSEVVREKVWRWYTSTAYTRLEGDLDDNPDDWTEDEALWRDFVQEVKSGDAPPFEGAIILIQTRWHEDDLAGRLIEAQGQGGDQWDILDLPALNDAGEALWPAKYNARRLASIRAAIGTRDWSALYQQRPAPEEGDYFKREWFNFYDELPKHLRMYGASDYAVTDKGGDYTVHGVAGVDPDDNLYIADIWRGQTESHVWIEQFIDMVAEHKPMLWAEEQGQIIKSLGPFIDKRMRERKTYCRREQFTSVSDKPTRSRSFQARAAMGKVYLPRNAPWLADLLSEMLVFPAGKNDDQVDVMGLIGRILDEMVPAHIAKKSNKRRDRWDRAFEGDDNSSWKTA